MKSIHPIINVLGILLIVPIMMLIETIQEKVSVIRKDQGARAQAFHSGTHPSRP